MHFDLIIIGTGSGNSIPSPDNEHLSIAIIEKGVFGGTCINVGCIPTKMFVYPSDVIREIEGASRVSVQASVQEVDWQDLQRRIFSERIDPISEGGAKYRRGEETPNITLFEQAAEFVGPRTLKVGDEVITGDQIVLATGTRPFIPEYIQGVRHHTNESIMRLPEVPETLTILGGGIVAVEFAHVFSALGSRVTLVNRSPRLLRKLDDTIVERFNEQAAAQWDLKLGRTVERAEERGDSIALTLDDGTEIISDEVLVAMGRINNSDTLNVEAGGVEINDNGRILVDDYGRTSADGVWALGDASNEFELKHVANNEQRVVAHNIAHPDDLIALNHRAVPSGVFTHPQIATVGMTEAQARDTGRTLTVKVQNFGDVAYGWAMEDQVGIAKVIADAETGEILGAHVLGHQAATLIQPFVTAMTFGIDARVFAKNQYWPHPALTEVVENALLGLEFSSPDPEGLLP
ncbi:mycothione reductase [Corynebacterium sp. zg254]|uniref:Mycothione reductase n=1 Tax=Corynebacterium zhongnanshanii TaxID=2768834 RepID=A0ABQ6VG07_9CORY|nr:MULTISPECIES: mycothione reductase [Corynebacterium]KAB3523349.1 mycothione reductase [Corynebacterium zhongnanshanii]MCR5913528.1 mycothione reductase [Corynebacterium sp. zg254]